MTTGEGRLGQDLVARVVCERPTMAVDVHLSAGPGEVVGVVGPNGAGKTTLLRVIAGLEAGEPGTAISVGGEAIESLPPHRRPVTYVASDLMLFPHLSVVDNVAFGLRARGDRRRPADQTARVVLGSLHIADLADRRPAELSAGQAQRVALARALALRPQVLLLDEPLAALDAATRIEVRARLRRDLGDFGGVTLLVTHDPVDALALADTLVVLEAGGVVQRGKPREVARRPRTPYVARLVGLNLLTGVASGARVRLSSGAEVVVAEPAQGSVMVAFPPTAVAVHRQRPEGSPRNVFPGRIEGFEPHGERVRLDVVGVVPVLADVTADAVSALGLVPGAEVWISVKAVEAVVYLT